MAEDPQRVERTPEEEVPCPNCAAVVKTPWVPGTHATCAGCGHEFVLDDPVQYWVEGEWDEGLT